MIILEALDSKEFWASTNNMIQGEIQLEPNLREEERIKLYLQYKKEWQEELEKAHKHPLWQEVKDYVNSIRPDILKQMKAKIVSYQNV